MTLPTFIVAGAPRCATTALHYYLAKHPAVCMSTIKEPSFFLFGADGTPTIAEGAIVKKSVSRLDDYRRLFRPSSGHRAIGEASPLYLSSRSAALRILEICGLIRIVCVVRQPADRAWSHFLYATPSASVDEATERFAELVDAELARDPNDAGPYRTSTHLLRLGRYGDQVEWYREVFGDNVHVMLTPDLKQEQPLAELSGFIGVEHIDGLHPDQLNGSSRPDHVESGLWPVLRRLQPVLKTALPPAIVGYAARKKMQLQSANAQSTPPPALDAGLRDRLTDWFADDIRKLSGLIDRDLDHWLEPAQGA